MTGAQLAHHLLQEAGVARDFFKTLGLPSQPCILVFPASGQKFPVGLTVVNRELYLEPPDLSSMCDDELDVDAAADLSQRICNALMSDRVYRHHDLNEFKGYTTVSIGEDETYYDWIFEAPDDIKAWLIHSRTGEGSRKEERAIAAKYVPEFLPEMR